MTKVLRVTNPFRAKILAWFRSEYMYLGLAFLGFLTPFLILLGLTIHGVPFADAIHYTAISLFPTAPFVHWMITRAAKTAALTGSETMQIDSRPPILYFRTFKVDRLDEFSRVWRYFSWGGNETKTLEEQLAKTLKPFGPFIAIGRPGEHLPQLGANRIYVPDDEWREAVTRLLAQCQAVFVRVGTSNNLHWELAEVFRLMTPQQILLIFNRTEDYLYSKSLEMQGSRQVLKSMSV